MRVYYFGCWNSTGHYMCAPGGRSAGRDAPKHYGDHIHLDGTLAPRRMRRTGALCWEGMGVTQEERQRIHCDAEEYPQGQFLRHELDTGYTAIQWWDRAQGDTRGACNSTLLVEGRHTSEEMVSLLYEHFPHVAANLARANLALAEVHL